MVGGLKETSLYRAASAIRALLSTSERFSAMTYASRRSATAIAAREPPANDPKDVEQSSPRARRKSNPKGGREVQSKSGKLRKGARAENRKDVMSMLCRCYVDIVSILCRYLIDAQVQYRLHVDIMSILCRYCIDIAPARRSMSMLCR